MTMTTSYLRRSIDPRNPYRRWIDPRLRSLRRAAVDAYLLQRGWKPLPSDRKGILVFQEPTGEHVDGRPLCQFVPEYEAAADYPLRMFELLTGLAEFEDRQASEVIEDILRLAVASPPNGPARTQVTDVGISSK
jgi:hypothetical protein